MLSLKNKRILVTGGAGFIGSHLVDKLILEKPDKIVVVDNFFLGNRENLKEAKNNFINLKIINQDATDFEKMKSIIEKEKIQVIFNLATKALEYSFTNPNDAYMVNVNLASVLLQLLHQKKFKTLIHCSSSEVYGSKKNGLIDESQAFVPETLYAAGKAAADLMIRSYYKTYKLDVAIVRPFNNYGPRQNDKQYSAVIPITMRRILTGQPPIIHDDGKQTRDFIFVEDTVRAMIEIYKNPQTRGEEINIASGKELKIKDLIAAIIKKMHYNGKILYKNRRIADVRRHRANTLKAKKILHFETNITFNDGIKKTIDYYVKNFDNNLINKNEVKL
jgi:UDP-glucose 4-epimerase